MSTTTTPVAVATFPTASILGLIFVTLKLLGYIAWSWLWVLAPFWVPFAIGFTVVGIYLAVLAVIALLTLFLSRK